MTNVKNDLQRRCSLPKCFKMVSGIGGTIELKCIYCGAETYFEARCGEEPPERCPSCGRDK